MVTEPRSTDPFDKSTSRTRTMTTTGRCEYVRSLFSTRPVGSSSPHRPGGSGWAGVANEIAAIVFPRTVPQNNGAKWRNLTLTHILGNLRAMRAGRAGQWRVKIILQVKSSNQEVPPSHSAAEVGCRRLNLGRKVSLIEASVSVRLHLLPSRLYRQKSIGILQKKNGEIVVAMGM